MPINVKDDLPAIEALRKENVFVMPNSRAVTQNIRPLRLAILNLMPNKAETETQFVRLLANSPLQITLDLIRLDHHRSKTSEQHLNTFYRYFSDIRDERFDGLIVTGAPLGQVDYDDVTYWPQLQAVFEWAEDNVTSTMFICWASYAALYHYYGLHKSVRKDKHSGVYSHQTMQPLEPLTRGFDDYFWAPHSRYAEVGTEDIASHPELCMLAKSQETGGYLMKNTKGTQVFVTGHPEYDRFTLDNEFKRDHAQGLVPQIPDNYYPDDDPDNEPRKTWRGHAYLLISNWLNYYVYQETPYNLNTNI